MDIGKYIEPIAVLVGSIAVLAAIYRLEWMELDDLVRIGCFLIGLNVTQELVRFMGRSKPWHLRWVLAAATFLPWPLISHWFNYPSDSSSYIVGFTLVAASMVAFSTRHKGGA